MLISPVVRRGTLLGPEDMTVATPVDMVRTRGDESESDDEDEELGELSGVWELALTGVDSRGGVWLGVCATGGSEGVGDGGSGVDVGDGRRELP